MVRRGKAGGPSRGQTGYARRNQRARWTSALEPEYRPIEVTPAPDMTSAQIGELLAQDPEFAEFVRGEIRFEMFHGRSGRNPFRR